MRSNELRQLKTIVILYTVYNSNMTISLNDSDNSATIIAMMIFYLIFLKININK